MDFVVFFTVEFLIFVVGALAFGYCLLSCTSIYDSRNYQFACYLCKEMVWARAWDRHRAECARQNEWYIDALPESPQVRSRVLVITYSKYQFMISHSHQVLKGNY